MSPRKATEETVAQAKTAKAKPAKARVSDAARSPIRVLLLDDETEHLDRTEEAIRSAWPFVAGPLRSAEVDLVLDRCEDVGAALEAVGTTETWQQAMGMVRRGGTINLFGGCPSGTRGRSAHRRAPPSPP